MLVHLIQPSVADPPPTGTTALSRHGPDPFPAQPLAGFVGELPYPQSLVWTAVQEDIVLAVPVAALASAWARTLATAHDALGVLLDLPNTVAGPLDRDTAAEAGRLLAPCYISCVRGRLSVGVWSQSLLLSAFAHGRNTQ